MDTITLKKTGNGVILVTSDENQLGEEFRFSRITDIDEQMLIALASFLGYEPAELLNLDNVEFDEGDRDDDGCIINNNCMVIKNEYDDECTEFELDYFE